MATENRFNKPMIHGVTCSELERALKLAAVFDDGKPIGTPRVRRPSQADAFGL